MHTWILIAVRTGVVLTVLALGLTADFAAASHVFRSPGKLARALLSMNVMMPLAIAAVIGLADVRPAIAIVLMALAVSPIPPILPRKALSAGGSSEYTIGLLVAAALLAIVIVPLSVEWLGMILGRRLDVSTPKVALTVAITVLAPVAAGLVIHRLAPGLAQRAAKPVSIAGLVLLLAGCVPLIVVAMPAIASLLGDGTLLALIAFVLIGLGIGHVLGGPDPDERTVLAFTTSSRHPGVALVIATATRADEKTVVAALLLYLLVNAVVSIPYRLWAKHQHAKLGHSIST